MPRFIKYVRYRKFYLRDCREKIGHTPCRARVTNQHDQRYEHDIEGYNTNNHTVHARRFSQRTNVFDYINYHRLDTILNIPTRLNQNTIEYQISRSEFSFTAILKLKVH